MKGIKAQRVKFRLSDFWESPILHVLLTKEDDFIVARCLDFSISSHSENEQNAMQSLADSVKEYVLTAFEDDVIDIIFDPAHNQYWRMYNELEAKHTIRKIRKSIKKSFESVTNETIQKSSVEINYA
jgi:hypothetical protein